MKDRLKDALAILLVVGPVITLQLFVGCDSPEPIEHPKPIPAVKGTVPEYPAPIPIPTPLNLPKDYRP